MKVVAISSAVATVCSGAAAAAAETCVIDAESHHCEVPGVKPECCTFFRKVGECGGYGRSPDKQCLQSMLQAPHPHRGDCPVADEAFGHWSDFCNKTSDVAEDFETVDVWNLAEAAETCVIDAESHHCEVPGVKPECCTFVRKIANCGGYGRYPDPDCLQVVDNEPHPLQEDCPVLVEAIGHKSDFCKKTSDVAEYFETVDVWNLAEAAETCVIDAESHHCEVPGVKPECCTFFRKVGECGGYGRSPDKQCLQSVLQAPHPHRGDCPVADEAFGHWSDFCTKTSDVAEDFETVDVWNLAEAAETAVEDKKATTEGKEAVRLAEEGVMVSAFIGFMAGASLVGLGAFVHNRRAVAPLEEPFMA